MATVEQALAATMRTLREQRGISQTSAARAIGIKQPTLANWENGYRTPSPSYLSCLASVYDTTPSQVYEISETDAIQKQAISLEQNINMKTKEKENGNSNKVTSKKKKK